MRAVRARPLGRLHGRPVFQFPVEITYGAEAAVYQVDCYPQIIVPVIAHTAGDAADLITDEIGHIPCVELCVYGPKGGRAAHRYWGFDRAIFLAMARERPDAEQLDFFG